ncbi:bifunctional [glutamine synthetase] adenylyltransferase/[glutamine synthetase]-adenylyl-L-tyrosine phosphorylase [Plantibacter sp. YIM 135249]|uniref:bifunctional [glutamine synthetase] adenylyltransferase/[glutamine synthetase]-adenylyl-L-tyrosine phosphorylase n=1 Tax=Plantibacter sp. YIM 135249 TaxID=3423918 RepID=UPI003D327C31
MVRDNIALSTLARLGFTELSAARGQLAELAEMVTFDLDVVTPSFATSADPGAALGGVLMVARNEQERISALLADAGAASRLLRLFGASQGFVDFFLRHPEQLEVFRLEEPTLPTLDEARASLLESVQATDGFAGLVDEPAWNALRTRYRRLLAEVALYDLCAEDPLAVVDLVAATLADLAAAAIDASIAVARAMTSGPRGPGVFPREEVAATRFAVIGMGKAGARELNYVSDVDVIFVGEGDEAADLENGRAVDIATRLAILTMRGIDQAAIEPGLWEVDPNLRPEGKAGALVRTLESHVAYYDRWAKSWEFQALLKARAMAGDLDLGERYIAAVQPKVWDSASREGFVGSVQRMRERVTEHIPAEDVHYQLKLGPGGLRDIEFTVQLLQLVHGQTDDTVHQRSTLGALDGLASGGYIGRAEAGEFADDYRLLRVLEHRLQLAKLQRTHLMPRDEHSLRTLARASTLASSADGLQARWESTKHEVRQLHERLFYRPLLSAVAALPDGGLSLTSGQAEARLAAIGFLDPRGALAHIGALTTGVSRRASIQRHLLPVMLGWFADGADPDYGLLAFRRLSEALGESHWFLRMLRDTSGAAERLTRVLSGSRFIGELMDRIPESAAWLAGDDDLQPRSRAALEEEAASILRRHESADSAAAALRGIRRREVLRVAMSSTVGLLDVERLAIALTDISSVTLSGILEAVRGISGGGAGIEFAIIAMGRYGGAELGLGSDLDVMYVYRPIGAESQDAQQRAQAIASELKRLTEDARLPLDLDLGLRPEGKNGPVVRSLDSYRAYYERWSLTWEAQALLRAAGVAGDHELIADFEGLADTVRYPVAVGEQAVREVKRIKARVESERLPQGADPTRHLKLGRGSLSDVEWYVQLLQMQHGADLPGLRTTSTLQALDAAVEAGLVEAWAAERLRAAWIFASRARSAMTLWLNKTQDVLPSDRQQLEGVARLLEYPPGSASVLEQDYLAVTRRARAVFELGFYGIESAATS